MCVNKAQQEGIGAYREEMVKGQHPFHIAECCRELAESSVPVQQLSTCTNATFPEFLLSVQCLAKQAVNNNQTNERIDLAGCETRVKSTGTVCILLKRYQLFLSCNSNNSDTSRNSY